MATGSAVVLPGIFMHRKELDFGFAGFCALADSDAHSESWAW